MFILVLPVAAGGVVSKRNAELTFASIELAHAATHPTWHHPNRARTCIEKRAIDIRARRVYVLNEVSGQDAVLVSVAAAAVVISG
jgi:hypothetical protein